MAMDKVVIRHGRPADVDAVIVVVQIASAARRNIRPTSLERNEQLRYSIRKPDAFLIVAEDAGTVVGMALGMQGLADDGAGVPVPGLCFLSSVYVVPDRWGKNIGGQIVDAVLATARLRGYHRVQLWTHADNQRAQRLYEGRGFRRSGREKDDDHGECIVHYEHSLDDKSVGKDMGSFLPCLPCTAQNAHELGSSGPSSRQLTAKSSRATVPTSP